MHGSMGSFGIQSSHVSVRTRTCMPAISNELMHGRIERYIEIANPRPLVTASNFAGKTMCCVGSQNLAGQGVTTGHSRRDRPCFTITPPKGRNFW